jgi:hypothetical protein
MLVSDGPYTETKEYMGGFECWKAADLNRAFAWGRQAVVACRAPLEVRPISLTECWAEATAQSGRCDFGNGSSARSHIRRKLGRGGTFPSFTNGEGVNVWQEAAFLTALKASQMRISIHPRLAPKARSDCHRDL